MTATRTLSIVIPAFNEEKFIGILLEKIHQLNTEVIHFEKEIIVVDDGSTDNTANIVRNFANKVTLIQQKNMGKGRAVQNGIKHSTGDFVLIQDADLEYDPKDFIPMLQQLQQDPYSSIYGSRFLGQIRKSGQFNFFPGKHKNQKLGPWIANIVLSCWTFILYGKWITDTLTAYKMYPKKIFDQITVETNGFETDHEITAKLIKKGIKIIEVPINYNPRTVADGKKIKALDGLKAIWTLVRFRF